MGRLTGYFVFALAMLPSLAAFALPSNCNVGTNVYYISQAGSDTNSQAQARNKSTAWQHAPYMHSFSGTYSHAAGDCFVFRGGDTWVATDYLVIANGGTSASPDYYGVDQSWYAGSSWNRPLFDIQGAMPNVTNKGSNIFAFSANWVTVDNWEIVHGTCSPTGPAVAQYYFNLNGNDGIVVTNGYYHAFQSPSAGCGSGVTTDGNGAAVWIYESVAAGGCNGSFDHNIVDGSDGAGSQGYETIVYDPSPCSSIAYNVVHDICSAFGGNFTLAHDNLIYNFGVSVNGGFNCGSQGIHAHAIRSNNDADVYNNQIHDTAAEVIMVNPNGMPSHPISHVYNNVLWHNGAYGGNGPVTAIQTGDNAPNTAGSIEIYNNTVDCDSNGGWGSCIHVENNINSVTIQNEHHILASGAPLGGIAINNPPFNSGGSGSASTFKYTVANSLFQSQSQAASSGYTNSETYVFSPTSSSSPTVGIGINATSSCGSDMPYLCSDTTYGSSQSGGVLSTPARPSNTRPASAAWDVGAYEFGGTPPAPPTGLTGVVN